MKDGRPTRQRIHESALRLFVEKGVTETSVRDLAQAAGIAEGTLYRHYASKDDLVADLFARNYTAFAHHLTALQAPLRGFRPRLAAVIGEIFRFHDDNPTLFRFLLLVQHQGLPRVADGADNPVSVLHDLVEQGITDGDVGLDDPALATAMILGLILQPATAIIYGRLHGPLSRFSDQINDACLRALDSTGQPTEVHHG